MSLAQYALPTEAVTASLEMGQRGQVLTTQADEETVDRIATLLRKGLQSGLYPRWTLRRAPGIAFSTAQLAAIADDFEEGFACGKVDGRDWRLIVYA